MNFSQYDGILRIVLPAAISFAVGKGWVTQDAVAQIGGALATIVAAGGWSALANTTPNLAKAVAAEPGLKVLVYPIAAPALQLLARDPEIPDIVHADLPRDPIYPPPDRGPYQTRRQS